jgi:hypothetical protein
MMRIWVQTILLAFNFIVLALLPAESLRQGAFVFLEKAGDIRVSNYLEGVNKIDPDAGEIMSALCEITATEGANACILASNGMIIAFEGAGSFSIERIEQTLAEANENDSFGGDSRVILELKEGRLLVDSTRYGSKVNAVIETSFGRMTLADESELTIAITENKKRKRYNLEIECNRGNADFLDREGFLYELSNGQRVSGYSKVNSLSLSFSHLSFSAESQFRRHSEKLRALPLADYDIESFKPFMPLLKVKDVVSGGSEVAATSSLETSRPIIIELAPPAVPTLPIRAIKK